MTTVRLGFSSDGRVQGARRAGDETRYFRAELERHGKVSVAPDIRPRLNEWVAEFALAGQAALEGPDWASRIVMFRVYYLDLAPYENARHFLGLSERSWVNWSEEIRRRYGKELLRRSMFPPRKYFASGE